MEKGKIYDSSIYNTYATNAYDAMDGTRVTCGQSSKKIKIDSLSIIIFSPPKPPPPPRPPPPKPPPPLAPPKPPPPAPPPPAAPPDLLRKK